MWSCGLPQDYSQCDSHNGDFQHSANGWRTASWGAPESVSGGPLTSVLSDELTIIVVYRCIIFLCGWYHVGTCV